MGLFNNKKGELRRFLLSRTESNELYSSRPSGQNLLCLTPSLMFVPGSDVLTTQNTYITITGGGEGIADTLEKKLLGVPSNMSRGVNSPSGKSTIL